MKKRLYVDMDGTLAHFNKVEKIEQLYEQGYFLNLPPHKNIVETIRTLNAEESFDVYILSAVLSDSEFARKEKALWINKYLPEIKAEQIIFTECGKDKSTFIKGGVQSSDILLDDYTVNLNEWTNSGGFGIKFVNDINSTHGTWQGKKVRYNEPLEELKVHIKKIINNVPEPKRSLEPIVFKCQYTQDHIVKTIFIAAKDELHAKALFSLHMPKNAKLINDNLSTIPLSKIKVSDKCLNFLQPNVIKSDKCL